MRPNRHTFGLVGVLLAMWYAGASQNNAAAYLLGFLTLSVAAVSAVHGWSNLRGLQLTVEPIAPVYEEEPVVLNVRAKAEAGRRHLAVRLQVRGSDIVHLLDCVSDDPEQFELLGPKRRRGRYSDITILVSSTFPLGFFTARRVVRIAQQHHVYPRPIGALPLPTDLLRAQEAEVGMTASEGDDFAGVSEWHRGQSMRHVDWKAVARGQRAHGQAMERHAARSVHVFVGQTRGAPDRGTPAATGALARPDRAPGVAVRPAVARRYDADFARRRAFPSVSADAGGVSGVSVRSPT